METPLWPRVTIVGCGLIGCSFARALKRAELVGTVAGWDSDRDVLVRALSLGIIDEIDPAFESQEPANTSTADLIYLAAPVCAIVEFLESGLGRTKPGVVITDAGSTKEQICRVARRVANKDRCFIPGHPLAGSHNYGPEHSRSDLFAGATYLLTNDVNIESDGVKKFVASLKAIGADVEFVDPAEHDRRMAIISHLPQLASTALVATALDQLDANELPGLAGAGFRDMSRLGASPWSMWKDIVASNRAEIKQSLDIYISKLNAISRELDSEALDPRDEFTETEDLFKQANRAVWR